MCFRYHAVKERLDQTPSSPQELAQLTEYVKGMAAEQPALQQKIDAVMVKDHLVEPSFADFAPLQKKYMLLEEFYMVITEEEFQEKWEVFGWPSIIKKKLSDVEKMNQIERLRMIRELRLNQKQLETRIYQLAEEASEIDGFKDLDQAISVG